MSQWTVVHSTSQKDKIYLNNNNFNYNWYQIIIYSVYRRNNLYDYNVNAFVILNQRLKLSLVMFYLILKHQNSSRERKRETTAFLLFKCLLKCAFPHNLFSI